MASRSDLVTPDALRALMAGEGNEPVSKMALSRWVQEGMPKASRGRYDPLACLSWYVARLRAAARQRSVEGEDGKIVRLDEAQRRLTLAKAENEEMTAKERRGELIPLELYVAEQAKLVTVTKQKMLNLPARASAALESLSRVEAKAVLTGFVKAALSELADIGRQPSTLSHVKQRGRVKYSPGPREMRPPAN